MLLILVKAPSKELEQECGHMDGVTGLANESWEALFRAQATLAREFELEGEWDSLPPRDYGVLYALVGAEAGLRICDLVDDALLTQAGVSRLVARLERRGLVERRADPDDARACRIVLTPEGRALQRRVGSHHALHVAAAMTRALTDRQMQTLRDLSRKLVAAAPPVRASWHGAATSPRSQPHHDATKGSDR